MLVRSQAMAIHSPAVQRIITGEELTAAIAGSRARCRKILESLKHAGPQHRILEADSHQKCIPIRQLKKNCIVRDREAKL